jgi:nucleotide-binding universal stress UspA family protein
MYKHILLPTDGSSLAQGALRSGIALAKSLGAKITVLTVETPFHVIAFDPASVTDTPAEYARHARQHAEHILSAAAEAAKSASVPCETMRAESDHPWQEIIATAERRGCDLIAMASHGRGGVSAIVLGSETLKVLTHSKIPVLVYR